MNGLSFRYCPVCASELDTGKAKFPAPYSILDLIESTGKYYSEKITEELDRHPFKSLLRTCDKEFIVKALGEKIPAGYCKECNKIFAEFEIME